ncbi:MAG: radical SAM protein [Chloroflexi bacterium]|nr:radical SAM protein [Chloroflexota bacterium]
MHGMATIANEAEALRSAVATGTAYKPIYVKLKLVWACNLRCVMCNHWRDHRAPALRMDHWGPVIDELAALGCEKLHISGGEPTLHPDLLAVIARAAANGMRVTMTTNATRIDKAYARALADSGLHGVNVSIDSPQKRLHDKIRGVKGSWKQTVAGADYLARCLRAGRLRINTVVTRTNYASLVDLPALASQIGAGSISLIPVDMNTPDIRPLRIRHLRDYNQRIAPVIAAQGLAAGLIQTEAEAYPFGTTAADLQRSLTGRYAQNYYAAQRCYAPWMHALIDHVGQVMVCCMLREGPVLGDLRQDSFAAIWSGDGFARLRQQTTRPLFPTCLSCDMFTAINQQIDGLIANV